MARNLIILAAVLGVLALSSPAKAEDPVQLEMWRTQNKLNQLIEQRIANIEKRVALLEQKVQTGYAPGSPPPAVIPSYAPPSVPPAGFTPVSGSPLSPAEQQTLENYFVRVGTNGGDPRMSPAEQAGWAKLIGLLGK